MTYMTRLIYEDDDSFEDIQRRHDDYKAYLFSIRNKLPKSTFDFAIANWHYNPNDHRCPHDASLDSLEITEKEFAENSVNSETETDLKIVLLNSKKNGKIQIYYNNTSDSF